MIIIGERINSSRSRIKKAIEEKDVGFIRGEATAQLERGAAFIDVNCGLSGSRETGDMEWLVNAIQGEKEIPFCIDSPSASALQAGASSSKGKVLINSITAEEERYKAVLPVALKHKCSIIALTMDSSGMPATAWDRVKVAEGLYRILKKEGVPDSDIYIDPLVRPVSSEPGQAQELLKAIPKIKELGDIKVVCGISNISYGLPRRSLVNSIFLSMALEAGLDGALIDPLDKVVMGAVRATEAVLGRDKYCMNYIKGHRGNEF